ncbi:MAG TPA: diguanylate cyclase [Acetobacteraceae bacterium]|jgi:diguanylate cyclase (GGDEF)-like protein|nr:diguanylate cyclase [Acetobacteraceae bacterium]
MNDTIAASSNAPAPEDVNLRRALLDSRQRWRDLVMTAADLVYEVDACGRFILLAPDPVLGWPTATLIGQPAELLLATGTGPSNFNPFRLTAPVHRRRAWLKRTDGSPVMLSFSGAPLLDAQGRVIGARGLGIDWTEFDTDASRIAASLRRGEVLDNILWRIGQEVLAPRMMQAALDGLMNAVGGEGAAVIDMGGDAGPKLIHRAGGGADDIRIQAAALLTTASGAINATTQEGRPIVVAACRTRFGAHAGIALWRSPGSRPWDQEEQSLLCAAANLICMVLEHEAIQHEMARQARTDPLTGLLNRRAFLEDMERHIDRLDREDQPGTLMFADLDNFKPVNDRLGHEAGDEVLQRAASMLRNAVRPSDIVARLGGDEFALWLNGADHMTAAERAHYLCAAMPEALREIAGEEPLPSISIGIATREAGSGEPVDSLLRRADEAMYDVKRQGRGHWRVARTDNP